MTKFLLFCCLISFHAFSQGTIPSESPVKTIPNTPNATANQANLTSAQIQCLQESIKAIEGLEKAMHDIQAKLVQATVKVSIKLSKNKPVLLDNYQIEAVVNTKAVTPKSYTFEFKNFADSTWVIAQTGTNPILNRTARTGAEFSLRVTVMIDSIKIQATKTIEELFPSYEDIIADQSVLTAMKNSWQSTLSAAQPNSRREEGFWIYLDTQQQKYIVGNKEIGKIVVDADGADISPQRPNPLLNFNNPQDYPTYYVAYFHSHTPMAYRYLNDPTKGRETGPSLADITYFSTNKLAGIVYDYVGVYDSVTGKSFVGGGYPLNSPAKIYSVGIKRRTKIY